ncbi:hypothetical protein HDU78_004871 [Chytriomyces hyalinus]|nr:hypothetical protein HDU78_004871 [Chytriomyces hyalinus]
MDPDAFSYQHTLDSHEEITTIFVVGFPEDIHEREFRGMFVFAPGFEAATLKYPTLLEADDRIPPCKKPIIGFAKFRSRTEANYARDLLNGRRIDSDGGAAAFILKAEIAKKNLHIKRSGAQLVSCPSLSEQFHHTKTFIQPTSAALTPTSATLVPSLSNSPVLNQNKVLAKAESSAFDENPGSNPVVPWSIFNLDAADSNPNAATSSFSVRPVKASSRLRIDTCDSILDGLTHKTVDNTESRNLTLCRNSPISIEGGEDIEVLQTSFSFAQNCAESHSSSNFMADADSQTRPSSFSARFAARINSVNSDRGFNSALFASDSLWSHAAPTTSNAGEGMSMGSLSINTSATMTDPSMNSNASGYGRSYSHSWFPAGNGLYSPMGNFASSMTGNMVGPTPASIASAGYRCPADHNPPCNTLYVGNLPVNTNEVELRDLFGRCAGYRRMSFRMRVNGPMVFVEFDSIPYAQQALNELHGTLLSNSVKGGIRLSFSKNPLGVRPIASHQQMNAQMSTSNWSSLPSPSLLTPISGLFGSGEMMV